MPAVAAAIGALLATAPAQAVSDLGAVIASAPSVVVVGTSWEVTWGAQNVGDPLLPGAVALSVEVEL
ncbi:MAG TPA: hypothetical protein VFX50_03990, partial [Gemmatimonadales bacterium]|nr:hypothetical protein [Gemmatimonadales bacterium]